MKYFGNIRESHDPFVLIGRFERLMWIIYDKVEAQAAPEEIHPNMRNDIVDALWDVDKTLHRLVRDESNQIITKALI
jgi:hypothetical protein